MHTFGDTAAGVPAFLAKLWRLVDDPDTNDLICWSKDGRSFIIQNQAKFSRELLPLNYKHNNMASFIRQLNMYGFHKITSIENGGLKFDRDEMEFSHPCFKRNHPYLLEHIKRKIATSKATDEKAALKPETVSKVLQDVRAMRGRQDSLDSRFSVMKQENEALWREIASLRQKHAKQQQIVNKLIQFLITIVQPTRNMSGVKRHMQLMINDIPENSKLRKTSESESEMGAIDGHGPVIHELSEELLDEVADSCGVMYNNDDCSSPSPLPIERPHSSISLGSQNFDYSNQSAEDLFGTNPSTPGTPVGAGKSSSGSDYPGSPGGQSIIQSINLDGSKVVYHVTEIPDAIPKDTSNSLLSSAFTEDNILQTPMVREQLLKQQKSKRLRNNVSPILQGGTPVSKLIKVIPGPQQQQQQKLKMLPSQRPIEIKIEDNCGDDPMQFLNVYIDNNNPASSPLTPQQQQQQQLNQNQNQNQQKQQQQQQQQEPQLISPNLSEDSRHSILSNGTPNPNHVIVGNGNVTLPVVAAPTTGTGAGTGAAIVPGSNSNSQSSSLNNAIDLYSSDFIGNDMPNDIFEETLLDNPEDSNSNLGSEANDPPQPFSGLQNTINNGTFSSFLVSGGNNGSSSSSNASKNGNSGNVSSTKSSGSKDNINSNGASTSAAATQAAAASGSHSPSPVSASLFSSNKNNNSDNMAVTKYKKGSNGAGSPTRLSTLDDVNDHLDTLQDELDSLKELLKSDGYSLDNSMLMSLFNDSDILGSYGLSLTPDLPNERKGNELITYQPSYDLSDIMSINSDSNLESGDPELIAPSNSGLSGSSGSVLNTPYHE